MTDHLRGRPAGVPHGPDASSLDDVTVQLEETHDDRELRALFARLPDVDARDQIVARHENLVVQVARRFQGRGEPLDDLIQVASIGLLRSIERFDVDRGVRFASYAIPTMLGELKRHFRDKTWSVHVPRRLQERSFLVRTAIDDLSHERGRSPTIAEVAKATELSVDDVLEALDVSNARNVDTLDAPASEGDAPTNDPPTDDDLAFETVEAWVDVVPAIRALPKRERTILYLRFIKGRSQSDIAAEIGISQMHVSRLLSKTLAHLREVSAHA